MEQVAIEIVEEDETIALRFEGFTDEVNALGLEEGIGGVEIVICNGEVPDTAVFIVGCGLRRCERRCGRDDFQHSAIGGPDEVVAGIRVVDAELKMIHIPLGKLLGVR